MSGRDTKTRADAIDKLIEAKVKRKPKKKHGVKTKLSPGRDASVKASVKKDGNEIHSKVNVGNIAREAERRSKGWKRRDIEPELVSVGGKVKYGIGDGYSVTGRGDIGNTGRSKLKAGLTKNGNSLGITANISDAELEKIGLEGKTKLFGGNLSASADINNKNNVSGRVGWSKRF